MYDSHQNTIYNNDFVNNVKQVQGGSGNLFADPEQGGNYWSDYSPNCTDVNNDGICDNPYPFNGGTVGVIDDSVWVRQDGWKYISQISTTHTSLIPNPQSNTSINTPNNLDIHNQTIQQKIPAWVKNIFIWYGKGSISDDELLGALQFLIQQGIIKVT